ncbi:ABC transporter substrate-binding protein [Bradyrhizobium sp. WSM2793]|uniref:ABC transporter substrate-binding protein n=1 Tax=Bradyrhizobium sp. WSM2793 TaxID=1038866 RepID=UPI0003A47376|nr:ABC transporter substrate-binding protein [Bradyrhizobium sp. WSM2793]
MSFLLNRRRFVQASSAPLIFGALDCIPDRAFAKSSGELRVLVNGGDLGRAYIEAYVKPFEAETGIKVTPVMDQVGLAQLELMISTNSVSVDVFPGSQATGVQAAAKGYVEQIDYSIYKQDELDAIVDFAKSPYSVGSLIYAYVMVYNTRKFPAGKARPGSWSEFWDVGTYPGVRSLVSGQHGTEGPWEEALLADGVAKDALYPMDIDRIFVSLDKIKPHIRKWWGTGSEIQQMMHDKVADLTNSYDGRATLLIDQGAPIEINRNQSKMTVESWMIPKGSLNTQNAQKFIEFATRAERQAAFAQLIPYGPTNRNAYKLIPEDLGRKFASHPDYVASSIPINMHWYGEVASDGMTNTERLIQRWNEWILR